MERLSIGSRCRASQLQSPNLVRLWYFLTGTKENVDFVLRKLGQYVDNKQDHLTVFLIGNERTGLCKKAYGLATRDELIKVVDSVLNDKPAQD